MSVCANNFFLVQISLPYTTIRKAIAPSRWTFVAKVMSLLFNMLPSLVIAFLPRNIFNFMTSLSICSEFGAQENKACSIVSPSVCHEVMGPDATILVF